MGDVLCIVGWLQSTPKGKVSLAENRCSEAALSEPSRTTKAFYTSVTWKPPRVVSERFKCGYPLWAVALSTPAGSPSPKHHPLWESPGFRAGPARGSRCVLTGGLSGNARLTPHLSDVERGRWSRGHCLGSPGSKWIGLLSPKSSGSRAGLATALNATPGPPPALCPSACPPSTPDVPAHWRAVRQLPARPWA